MLCILVHRRVNTLTRWQVNNKIVLIRAHVDTRNWSTLRRLIELLQCTVNTKHPDTVTPPPGDMLNK